MGNGHLSLQYPPKHFNYLLQPDIKIDIEIDINERFFLFKQYSTKELETHFICGQSAYMYFNQKSENWAKKDIT